MFELISSGEDYLMREGDVAIPLKKFSECKNRYSGSVFLLASGGSAKEFPVSRYAHIPFIAMNGSILRLVDEKVRPLFFLCNDLDFPKERPDVVTLGCQYAQHVAMALENYSEVHSYDKTALAGKSLYLLERVNRYYNKKSVSDRSFAWSIRNDKDLISGFSLLRQRPNRIGFSKDVGRGHFCGRTIAYAALQVVYTLGFRNIFIIGMDLNTATGRFYENPNSGLNTTTGHSYEKPNEVFPTSIDVYYEPFILASFRFFQKNILEKQDDLRVFNLSLNSRLPDEVIPKISLDQLDQLL